MATPIVPSARTDPRYLLRKSIRLMAKTLSQLAAKADRKEVKSKDGGVLSEGGLGSKEIDSLISLTNALHRLSRQADADEVARYRQLKGMTDEQLEEQERRLKSAQQSEAIKEGLRNKKLAQEVPLTEADLEEDDDGDTEADS